VIRGDGSEQRASRCELQRFPDDVDAGGVLARKGTIRLKYEFDGLGEVRSSFLQRCPLGIGARQLLDVADVPAGNGPKHGGELNGHDRMITPIGNGV